MSNNEIFDRLLQSWQHKGPQFSIGQLIQASWITNLVYVAAELGIADLLKDGAKSIEELARATNTNQQALYRVLRALAGFGIFRETDDRYFELSAEAECLRSDVPNSLLSLIAFSGGLCNRVWSEIGYSVKTGKPAFEHIFGMNSFEFLTKPENGMAAKTFGETLVAVWNIYYRDVAAAYDFSSINKIVDVGGNHGMMLASILGRNPAMSGVLFDLPPVVEMFKQRMPLMGLAGRCEAVAGNFFEQVPAGADAYLLSQVLHDWTDEQSVAILRNCHSAMGNNGKLLVVEMALKPGNDPMYAKLSDIIMMLITGGAERSEDQYRALFKAAGFELGRVVRTPSMACILEGVPV